ncbi:baseplate complex protein [Ursidibacter sp. B-7004-1]
MSQINNKSSIENSDGRPKPSVQLALDGKPVYLHNFLATVKVSREEKDMSGQKSSTKKSDKGVKAKEISITGLIPFREKKWLTDLFTLAEATTGKNEQKKYRITNVSAEAINMREVQFSGDISAVEQNVQGWSVSFTLREVNSVAEKKEQRAKKPQAKVQSEKAPMAKPQNTGYQQSKSEDVKGTEKDDSFWGKLNNAIGE